jgi:uncharacterized damage-inducible protein DinB
MTHKEILLEQLASVHDQRGWFVTINDALTGLSPELASWNNGVENHSIWQIVHHLIFWNERWQNKFMGRAIPKMEGDNKSTFSIESSSENWSETLSHIDKVFKQWITLVDQADEARLLQPVIEGEKDPWYTYLYTIVTHNAYHIGQIVTLRKQQGSWDPDQGITI